MHPAMAATCIVARHAETGLWTTAPRVPLVRHSAGMVWSAGAEVFRGSQARRAGVLTMTTLRGPRWRRLFRDVYVPVEVPVDHPVRCRGAALLLPAAGALAGRSAACLWGVPHPAAELPVEVVVPPGVRFGPVKGIEVHTEPLPEEDVALLGGVRITTLERTAWDLARRLDLVEAVVVLDALGRSGLVDQRALARRAECCFGRKGSRRARIAIGLSDLRSGSPDESRLRVRLVLAGIPAPVVQHEVRDRDSYPIGYVALAWPERRVALNFASAVLQSSALATDRRRANRAATAGWLLVHATPDRLHDDWPSLVGEVRAALGRPWR